MDVQNRVVNYYKNNQFIQNYIKGIDVKTNEVVLFYNGENKKISIDILENINSEEELMNVLNGKTPSAPLPEVNETKVEEPVKEVEPAINVQPVEQTNPEPVLVNNNPVNSEMNFIPQEETLNDIKILTELKNKEGLDNVLKKIAVNPTTGLIDINTAITKVTRTTMDEVENAINNNTEFSTNLSDYNIEGKFIGTSAPGSSTVDEKIIRSFNNVKVLLDASKMYPEQANYNEEQINAFMKTYMDKVKEELKITPDVVSDDLNTIANDILDEPVASTSAGFADIFVLTVIVLVYAVIIINLVMKLS